MLQEMVLGDFERTFGAGADVAAIIDGLSDSQGSFQISPQDNTWSFSEPDGLGGVDLELYRSLIETADEEAKNCGVPAGTLFSPWELLKIVVEKPATVESMNRTIGMHSSGCAEQFVELIKQSKLKAVELYGPEWPRWR